ncbi:nucleotidyltransferase family protein [Herbiconiux solani]|uniref:nucleotidyltransferase family protein n=1 Tax=Herbiconiux solani TaxID=661329 RepID=UPI00082404FB|nr:nucleotidyltransferase family protein [Herbiconiux solani]
MDSPAPAPRLTGLLLAAGAGRRMGGPKALVAPAGEDPWIVRSARLLLAAGCDEVVVVLGAEATAAEALLRRQVPAGSAALRTVVAEAWSDGLGASLRAGLTALLNDPPAAVLITLVDLPWLRVEAARRVLEHGGAPHPRSLRQAIYGGRPGHPVLVGADHLGPLAASLEGDVGARPYLAAHGVELVDCSDLGGGDDVDELPPRS